MTATRVRVVLQNNGVNDAPVGTVLFVGQGSVIEGDPDNLVYNPDDGTLSIVNELIMYGDGAPDNGAKAGVTIDPAGNDNALDFTAQNYGVLGNDISITYVDPGADDAEISIEVGDDNSIVVNLATDSGGTITTIASDITTAIEADAAANALVAVANHGGDDGSGLVTAIAKTPLTGGLGTGLGTIKAGGFYIDETNGVAYTNTGTTDDPVWVALTTGQVQADAVADAAAYTAPIAGAVAVLSNAADDLTTAGAEIADLKVQFNLLLGSLRAAGILATS